MVSKHQVLALALLSAAACGQSTSSGTQSPSPAQSGTVDAVLQSTPAPSPDPRVGLRAGRDAAEAVWNLKVVSKTPPSTQFVGSTNSDLAFKGNYVIQGNYNGYQIWDITNPQQPVLKNCN